MIFLLLQIRLNLYEIALMGVALGFLLGLLPLILGFIKKERSYAVFGFLGSMIGGGISPLLISIPVVAIFTWLILRRPKNAPTEVVAANETPIDVNVENPDNR